MKSEKVIWQREFDDGNGAFNMRIVFRHDGGRLELGYYVDHELVTTDEFETVLTAIRTSALEVIATSLSMDNERGVVAQLDDIHMELEALVEHSKGSGG